MVRFWLEQRAYALVVISLITLGQTAPQKIKPESSVKENVLSQLTDDEKITLNSRWDLGYYLFQIQEFSAAAQEFEKIRVILPSDASLLALIGSCYTMSGRWQLGEAALMEALKQNPEDEDINGLLGQFYISAGKPLQGAVYLEKSLKVMPDQDDLRSRLAKVYLDAGQNEAALEHLQVVLKNLGTETFENPDLDYDYARCLVQVGNYSLGLKFAEKAYRAQTKNTSYARILGLCQLGLGKYGEASQILGQVGLDFQADADLLLHLGEAQFMDKHWEEAEATWLKGCKRFPGSYPIYSRLIEYYLQTARPARAEKILAFAEKANIRHPGNLLLQVQLKRKLSNYASALKSLDRLKRQSCGALNRDALWEEAVLDFVSGKYSSCNKLLDNLIANKNHKSEAHLLKAKIALYSGDKIGAQSHLIEAKNAKPFGFRISARVGDLSLANADLAKLAQPEF